MKVGLFDHVAQTAGKSLATLFDERLEFAMAADAAGFWRLHLAEHHCTPLNAVSDFDQRQGNVHRGVDFEGLPRRLSRRSRADRRAAIAAALRPEVMPKLERLCGAREKGG